MKIAYKNPPNTEKGWRRGRRLREYNGGCKHDELSQ
jgi:hypothetical protein